MPPIALLYQFLHQYSIVSFLHISSKHRLSISNSNVIGGVDDFPELISDFTQIFHSVLLAYLFDRHQLSKLYFGWLVRTLFRVVLADILACTSILNNLRQDCTHKGGIITTSNGPLNFLLTLVQAGSRVVPEWWLIRVITGEAISMKGGDINFIYF